MGDRQWWRDYWSEREPWRFREQFPSDPYCVHCGTGKEWSEIHGHMPKCPLFVVEVAEGMVGKAAGELSR
jgi:Uma2 family endonuclease